MRARRQKVTQHREGERLFDIPRATDLCPEVVPEHDVKRGDHARRIIGKISLPPGLQWSRFICPDGLKMSHVCYHATRELITLDQDGTLTILRRERSHTLFEFIEPEVADIPAERLPVTYPGNRQTPLTSIAHTPEHMKCSTPPEI